MKRVFAIFLALLMLTTNVGLSFATHYCGGRAVKTSITFSKHSDMGCGMEKMSDCENEQAPAVKSNCCQDKFIDLKIQDDFNTPKIFKSNKVNYKFVATFLVSIAHLYFSEFTVKTDYLNYIPPLLSIDIPVLIQSFLI